MRILFICGSLENGKDGVGDYTRQLASGVCQLGHETQIIAINDRFTQIDQTGLQYANDIGISVTRLSYLNSWNSKLLTTKSIISNFDPDWISLQFVIFIFDNKGLPFTLIKQIEKLDNKKAKWHIMFHELWVAMNKEATFKLKLLGAIQRQIINSLVRRVYFPIIHTQSPVYKKQLEVLGYKAKLLPLFSNLCVNRNHTNLSPKNIESGKPFVFILFGGIHPNAPVEAFADELMMFANAKQLSVEVRIVGRAGEEGVTWRKVLEAKHISVKIKGELPANEICDELKAAHYGISTTPFALAEKSGSIAAMLSQGLAVICVAKSWQIELPVFEHVKKNVFDYKKGNLSNILNIPIAEIKALTYLDIAAQFANDLL